VDCLIKFGICHTYYLAKNRGTSPAKDYHPKFALDAAGNERALALFRSLPDWCTRKGLKVTATGVHTQGDGILRDASIVVCDGANCDGVCTGNCAIDVPKASLLLPGGSRAFPAEVENKWCPCDDRHDYQSTSYSPTLCASLHFCSACLCPVSGGEDLTCSKESTAGWTVNVGQEFCDKGIITYGNSKATSFAQGRDSSYNVLSDDKQDLVDTSYTFNNGRMQVTAYRPLHTTDSADLKLSTSSSYYVLFVTSGSSLDIGYHGSSVDATTVCVTNFVQKGECKAASSWQGPPCLPGLQCATTSYSPPADVGSTESSPASYDKSVGFTMRISGVSPSDISSKHESLRKVVASKVGCQMNQVSIVGVTSGSAVVQFEILATSATADTIVANVNSLSSNAAAMTTLISEFATDAALTASMTGSITVAASAADVTSCQDVTIGDMTASWALGSERIRMQVAYNGIAWVAFGFQENMIGSNIIVGEADAQTVRHIGFTSKASARTDTAGSTLDAVSIAQVNGQTQLTFSYPLAGSTGEMNAIAAHGTSNSFGYHSQDNRFQLKLNFQTCGVTNVKTVVPGWKVAHGTMMLVAWCVLVPLAIIAARFMKSAGEFSAIKKAKWLAIHLTLNTTAVLVTIFAAIYALKENESPIDFSTAEDSTQRIIAMHFLFGKIILGLVGFQLIIGYVRPHKNPDGPQTSTRWLWELLHMNLGRVLGLIAVTNCIMGLVAIDYSETDYKWLFLSFIIILCILAVVAFVLQIRKLLSNEPGKKTSLTEPPQSPQAGDNGNNNKPQTVGAML